MCRLRLVTVIMSRSSGLRLSVCLMRRLVATWILLLFVLCRGGRVCRGPMFSVVDLTGVAVVEVLVAEDWACIDFEWSCTIETPYLS